MAHYLQWRIHPKAQQDALAEVLDRVGWVQNVIESARTGYLLDGHARVALALRRGDDEPVPYVQVDVTEEEEALILGALDPIGALAGSDKAKLEELLAEVRQTEEALAETLADVARKARILPAELPSVEETEAKVDQAEELRQKWGTERGQVWVASRHRLMCGDSLSSSDVSLLLEGDRPDLVVTDPPYDMPVSSVRQALSHFADRAAVLSGGKQAFGLAGDGWRYCFDLVWKTRQPRSFPTPYQPVFYHHNILMLRRGEAPLGWQRPFPNFGSVIELEETEFVDTEFGHGKSPGVFVAMLQGFAYELCADPFMRTGASVLACETLGKVCYAMELDPTILAVALERVSQYGLVPTLAASH